MNDVMLVVLFAAGLAGFGFFATRWLQLRSGYKAMSTVEQRYAEVSADAEASRSRHNSRFAVLRRKLRETGWPADIFSLIALAGSGYLAVAVGLRIAGLTSVTAALIALPVAVGAAWMVTKAVANRRVSEVNKQMIVLLDLMVGQVRGGVGAERAMILVTPSLPQPLRGEISTVLDRSAAGADLIEQLQLLEEKYPSRAFALFIAALEMDRSEGAQLEPALTQATEMLKRSFALQSEARAELSSTRWEFIGVTAVIVAIAGKLVIDSQSSATPVYANPVALLMLLLAAGNVVWGIIRFNRMIDALMKETT